jgi:hypothetical protein
MLSLGTLGGPKPGVYPRENQTIMRGLAPLVDITDYLKPQYSHRDALNVTGLTADTILTWHKRGLVPTHAGTVPKGRGNRREYSEFDLAYLVVMKHLAPALPLAHAALAANSGAMMVHALNQLAGHYATAEELNAMPTAILVAYQDADGTPRYEVLGHAGLPSLDPLPEGGLPEWMRQRNLSTVTVLDLNMITFKLLGDIHRLCKPDWAQ